LQRASPASSQPLTFNVRFQMPTIPKHIFWMTRALEQGLTQGVKHWAEDTQERSNWLNQDKDAQHVIAGTMLVSCLAYAEGRLGRRWWNNMHSTAAKRDLNILWIVRNSFVHKDSVPKDLDSTDQADLVNIESYCKDLKDGKNTGRQRKRLSHLHGTYWRSCSIERRRH
jgi:hypothetical protein